MVKLTIDHRTVEAPEGTTIMEAAATLGISIPSMCYLQGHSNHPSCMVCMVKDLGRDQLVPSCAMPVAEGMEIMTGTEEVITARKEALELLLSDHVGDCEAPCRVSCPAYMDIPLMNRQIATGEFDRALHVVREEIALPLVLGFICPAPCEKACKRKPMDGAVTVCLLKRSAAQQADGGKYVAPAVAAANGKNVAVIGTGPAGLSAAFYLLRSGHAVTLFDAREKPGGMMRTIPEEQLPAAVLDAEIGIIRKMGAVFTMNTTVTQDIFREEILQQYDAVILASGHQESGPDELFGLPPVSAGHLFDRSTLATGLPGVFVCGNIIREQKMAVQSAAHGKTAAQNVESFLGTSVIHHPSSNAPHPPAPHAYGQAGSPEGEGEHRASGIGHRASVIGHLFESEWNEYLQEAIPDHRTEPAGGHLSGFTAEEAIREAQRCMRCDCRKPVSCKLRVYSEAYGASRRRFAGPSRKTLTRSMQHETVVYETEKCIRCGLCIDITEMHGEEIGLTFAGRGFDVRVAVPFNETTREAMKKTARECVEACPTGALAFKITEERNNG